MKIKKFISIFVVVVMMLVMCAIPTFAAYEHLENTWDTETILPYWVRYFTGYDPARDAFSYTFFGLEEAQPSGFTSTGHVETELVVYYDDNTRASKYVSSSETEVAKKGDGNVACAEVMLDQTQDFVRIQTTHYVFVNGKMIHAKTFHYLEGVDFE